jgi:hypothetical protein
MIPDGLVSIQDERIMSNNATPAEVEEAAFNPIPSKTTS